MITLKKNFAKKAIFNTLLFFIAFASVERFCHKEMQGFSLRKIRSNLNYNSDWECHPPSEYEMNQIISHLSQPYYFLNSGGEFYAFVSKDGQYVIKFFKHHHMRPKSWVDSFLPKSIQNYRLKKLNTLFLSCKLAFDRFRNETGLIYLHLNKTQDLHLKLHLFDPIGVMHKIDLDHFEFAFQKKASMAYPTITALMNAREFNAAKVRLSSLINLIANRCRAGLAEHDARKRNFGFIGEQAIEIDLGSFSVNEALKDSEEMTKILLYETAKLRCWIKKYHPELFEFVDEKINDYIILN